MQIRQATDADLDAIRACARAAYAPYVPLIGKAPAPMVADFAAQIGQGLIHVAGDDAPIFGYIVYFPRTEAMFLESVAVDPAFAGRGIGGRLIAHCEAAARRAGQSKVRLYTNEKMTANLTLYPHLGYRKTERRHEDGFDRVYFEKHLG